MIKKGFIISTIILLMVVTSACSGLSSLPIIGSAAKTSNQGAQAGQNGQNGQNGQQGFQFDPAKMPVDQKLAVGILKLEGTSLAVTPAQAKILLPLWTALKALSTNNNTTTDEINALFQQMQGSLTPDQVAAIQKMTWQQSDLQTLAQQYGVQFAQGGGDFGNLTPEQRATAVARFRANDGAAGNGGGTVRGGGGGAFFGGGGFGGGGAGANGQVRSTPNPAFAARRSLGGLNRVFADAVIKLLTQKSAA